MTLPQRSGWLAERRSVTSLRLPRHKKKSPCVSTETEGLRKDRVTGRVRVSGQRTRTGHYLYRFPFSPFTLFSRHPFTLLHFSLFTLFFPFFLHDNIVVMWIVLIRENVTAGVSGRIDKGTEKRLEMMWCQHGCHSCKEQEVYNAVRTTQLDTVQQRPVTLPSHQRTLRPLGVTGGLSLQKLCLFDETGD